jgi:hypothetical protein
VPVVIQPPVGRIIPPTYATSRLRWAGPVCWAAGARFPYDATSDGQRFLVNTVPEQASEAPVTVVVNWLEGVGK